MLRVGVDAWNIPGDRRGIGRYVRALLRAWHDDFAGQIEPTLIVPEWHTLTVRGRYERELDGRRYRIVSRAFHDRANLDVLWFPFNGCSWTSFERPAVATLHDATPFVYAESLAWMQSTFLAAVERCAALVTDSVFSQHELARDLGIAPERLTPIHLGVAPAAPGEPDAFDTAAFEPYVLFVGTSDRRKGLDVLCEAMARVQHTRPDLRLVLAGERSDRIVNLGGVRAEVLGYVDDAALAQLYRRAALFAFPSRYEGFGLPVLEAMQYGVPVVASDIPALREAAADAAVYAGTGDPTSFADAILAVANDGARAHDLRERGRGRAATMTWLRTAGATLDVLERAAR